MSDIFAHEIFRRLNTDFANENFDNFDRQSETTCLNNPTISYIGHLQVVNYGISDTKF